MPKVNVYNTLKWQAARSRAIERDKGVCTVSRLLGGECSPGALHVHHIRPVNDGGAPYDLANLGTACASHHPAWEGLRRRLLAAMLPPADPGPPVCRHTHRTLEGRLQCEARMARQRARTRIAA